VFESNFVKLNERVLLWFDW